MLPATTASCPGLAPTQPNWEYSRLIEQGIQARLKGDFNTATACILKAIRLDPERVAGYHNFGIVATDQGDFMTAGRCSELAWERSEGCGDQIRKQIGLGLAQNLMRLGEFETAGPLWEYGRLRASWWPSLGSQVWDGSPGKRVVVIPEGGYGDFFMFHRWLQLLKARSERVRLVIWRQLADWCDWAALGVDEVTIAEGGKVPFDVKTFDLEEVSISLMSLPIILGMKKWTDIPAIAPRKKTIGRYGPLRIGFCWRSEENTSPVRTKSLPVTVADAICQKLRDPQPMFSLSPQRAGLHNADEFREPGALTIESDCMASWRTTADYISSMDFVLTVDTAVAHLAGLLGVPTLILLPKSSCWRWGMPERTVDPWYGGHVTYYRQPKPREWDAEDIVRALTERLR
ncbi:MAG TPA: hypothetical protein VKQ11_00465 [Candidatus Sulfotelmatobacter sp.]|nr:hypothetical protein [Candidatus Sulfotelmatobacter sp.]